MAVDPETYAVARWLRQQRRLRDLSQQQVADLMRVDRSCIAKIETGRRDLTVSDLRRYMAALGVGVVISSQAKTGVVTVIGLDVA